MTPSTRAVPVVRKRLAGPAVEVAPTLLNHLLVKGNRVGRIVEVEAYGGRDDPAYLRDGIFQPPRGVGRLYLDAFQDQDLVEVDAVGGTALLVRADLHRDGLNFPTFSYRGYIETEGLAMMARDMGARCWGLPNLRIVHG